MKISQVKIANFRSYANKVCIDFNNLTAFVGKNDVGKSTVLEALDIFFNEGKGVIKLDKEDINKGCAKDNDKDIKIAVVFEKLPESIIIDDSNQTTLADEYLLKTDGKLEVIKIYPEAGKEKIFIKAAHPTNPACSDLLQKKQADLKKIIKEPRVCDDLTKNASMRKAIWNHYKNDLQLQEIEIDVSKEDAKNIWTKLKEYMPLYSLFQSDRKNSDGDSEIQDPMKLAVQEILKDQEIIGSLNEVAIKVTEKLKEVADGTCAKLQEMNPEIAKTLHPVIPSSDSLKWLDVFKSVSISGDDDIPLNKRGSGVKRLVLLNFFRAEAERRKGNRNVPDVIYAIEEPETSQHPDHQKKLIDALITLSQSEHTQIILTTHSPSLVKMLKFEHLRLVQNKDGAKQVLPVEKNELPYPSLNEVNFLAFFEANEEYHNELYGFIEHSGWLTDYKTGKEEHDYHNSKSGKNEKCILSVYIRNQIHHPENTCNIRFTPKQLLDSVSQMRDFINQQRGVGTKLQAA
ncbi:MAG: ATP-binding protein [Holosporales bacterium]|jgi:predicted ATP-dependent endonuclease of OLD family